MSFRFDTGDVYVPTLLKLSIQTIIDNNIPFHLLPDEMIKYIETTKSAQINPIIICGKKYIPTCVFERDKHWIINYKPELV